MKSTYQLEQSEYLKQLDLFPVPYSGAEKQVMRSGIKFFNEQTFRIPYPVSHRFFTSYYLLYWSGSYLLKAMETGYIEHNGILYKVIFHKKDGITRGKILAAPDRQFALSFRIPHEMWRLEPVVIISFTTPTTL